MVSVLPAKSPQDVKFFFQDLLKCLPYQLLCHSMVQMAATKSLYTLLQDGAVLRLLTYQPPPLEVVATGNSNDTALW